jgi:hypothetical protein
VKRSKRSRRRGYHYLYDPVLRRLYVSGSCFGRDRDSIGSLIRQRTTAWDLDAVVYVDVGCTRIIRGRVLELLVEINIFWLGFPPGRSG